MFWIKISWLYYLVIVLLLVIFFLKIKLVIIFNIKFEILVWVLIKKGMRMLWLNKWYWYNFKGKRVYKNY